MPPPTCPRCGDTLPDDTIPGARTCREWADGRAREAGDMLDQDTADALMTMRLLCRLSQSMDAGSDTIGDP